METHASEVGTDSAVDPRYLRIRPTDHQLDPETIETQFRRLHGFERADGSGSWYSQWFDTTPAPTFEWLLVTDGDTSNPVEYYLNVNEGGLNESIRRVCRELFPNEYELEYTDQDPVAVLQQDASGNHSTGATDPTVPDHCVAITFDGVAERRRDWQTSLTDTTAFDADAATHLPLATVVETLRDSPIPMVYQTLLRPYSEWTHEAAQRREQLIQHRDTPAQRIASAVVPIDDHDPEDHDPDGRLAELRSKDPQHSFGVTVRAVAAAPGDSSGSGSDLPLSDLSTAFAGIGNSYYSIDGVVHKGDDAREQLQALRQRRCAQPAGYPSMACLPWTENRSRGIVADATEAPVFCVLDGSILSTGGRRAMAPTPRERTMVPRPPTDQLTAYHTQGLALGYPLDQDGTAAAESVVLPPELQSLHLAWFGKTGSGKSTALVNGLIRNQQATDGADILIDPKGDGMAETYLRAHYATHGDLEDIYYFDCTETLPSLSFFDIRDQLAAGIDRTTAVEDVVDHYIDILRGMMGRDRFEQAIRSPDIIRQLCKAQFDPVHGADAFTHRELQESVAELRSTQDPPGVMDPDLQAMLTNVAANTQRSFQELMQGVANRIEKIPLDARLAQLFNHVPHEEDPHLDLRTLLDEDAVVILDTGGLRRESRRVVTLVMLSVLWSALRRRRHQSDGDLPLVNVYLEEAAELAETGLLGDLLARSRSFGLSITLAMQFPAQLHERDPEAYAEVLNNVSSVVTGNVAVDSRLAERLTTAEMSKTEVSNRLRSLQRGQWFVNLPAAFGQPEPRPFMVESLELPPGHPEGDDVFSSGREATFQARVETLTRRTREEAGLDVALAGSQAGSDGTTSTIDDRVDSPLPFTKRLPEPVTYHDRAHALACETCENRYDPSVDGMYNAIRCCHSLDAVDRDEIPICDLSVKLTENEWRRSQWTPAQLRFLQAVYLAHQRRFDPDLEFDLLRDSMVRLREYVGLDQEGIDELVEAGLLRKDCDGPRRLYTVSAEGRDAINVGHRAGVAHGDGFGDVSESSLHVAMVEIGRRYIEHEYATDPDSPVSEAVSYHEHPTGDGRFDAVGLDSDGEVVVVLEAERPNNDIREAAPRDYDKMAACDPIDAIWVAKNREEAHEVLEALNEPADGDPRVEKTYSRNSPPNMFQIDEPGFSVMRTMGSVYEEVRAES